MNNENLKEIDAYNVLGIDISIVTPKIVEQKITKWAKDKKGRFICVRDVASLMVCINDPNLLSLHKEAAMVTPDGMPLALIGKLQGLAVKRTTGSDLMETVCFLSKENNLKHYFYGGKKGVAEKLAKKLSKKYPNIQICGFESPPFRPLTSNEDKEMLERIKTSGADVVWVGMSSPKQDVWMRDHYKSLPQTLIGVGAAFDFLSGEVRRAPQWMQKSGLEWAHRLFFEPKRLWYRYLILAPKFVIFVSVDYLKKLLKSLSAHKGKS